ncbi:hypothetical protein EDF88_0994 [Buttiauxella sp. BIGb0552]|uniref:hypothetical protein n=1 Tax=Buttiauxella sp. BIGb0552 TaxID=2485120 RepID=UPI0010D7DF0D|nr:hypothetical protein [Buttiauxella sp. BIGb0552]TDX18508.1 hypothetical protein EDF88_0994 [Buttiauxella sp. BIGb0552]
MSTLIQLLDRPIAYNPAFAKLKVGKVKAGPVAAVFLSQMVYWHNRMGGAWMYKTQADITSETALTRDEQETARKRLVALGVLEEDRRGVPATMHYRIDAERLETLLLETTKSVKKVSQDKTRTGNFQNVETPQSGLVQPRNQECGNAANKIVETPRTSMGEHPEQACGDPAIFPTGDYTESTQEITQDKKPLGQSPKATDPQQVDTLKIDYPAVLEAYHTTLPEMPKVLKLTDKRRKHLRKLWKDYELTEDRWGAYLRYISKKCRWMLEDRPDMTSGKTWRKKDFDYLITEECYLKVKEERANDLPKVAKIDSAEREEALNRLVSLGRKPKGRVEELAMIAFGKSRLQRANEVVVRAAWKSIWAQALTQASEEDLARIAS